ncbi:MAG TPA: ABC transporter ATP-binding protein [Polyangiaceae bacterium]|nr:ABC transporter ATP-binding protein [Polyangiaceae bacterium]
MTQKAPVAQKKPGTRAEAALRAFHEESAFGKAYDTRLARRLWPYMRPYQFWLWLSIVLGLVMAGMGLLRPYLMRITIDQGASAKDPKVLFWGGLSFAAVVLVEQVLNFVQVYAVQISGARALADLRRDAFGHLQSLRLGFFDKQPVGRLVTRVTNDIDAILELFASGALNAVVDLVKLVGIVIVMVGLDWRLSLVGFAAAPVVALLVQLVRRKSRDAFRAIRAKTAEMNANMNEQVSGMAVVQAFCREERAAHEFDVINSAYRDANIASIKYEAVQDAAIEMVTSVCLASIIVALGYHPVSFGTVVAFNAYLLMFFEPISALAQRYTLLQSAMAGAERVFGLLDLEEFDAPKSTDAASAVPAGEAAFSFDHVTFEYKPGVPVLEDVTFRVKKGEKIAVVGPTGAGKTTLASVLLRLYDVSSGVVRVDGADVRSLDRTELRSRFAVVPQDVFLFPGTVLSNVAVGDPTPDRARVEQALRRIDALDLFQRRPGGLDARVDERGENFSAGERQLIAFARALYRDAPIIMLDEATASVDSDTEARVQRALDELMKGRTALIIAHRLSTVRAADRILGFQRGRLVEEGTHSELLRKGGLYAKLHRLHFARQDEAALERASAE